MKSRNLVTACMATALLLGACQSENENNPDAGSASEPKTVTDGVGNEVTIPNQPERIIGSYLEDPLVTLGVTPVVQWSVASRESTQVYLEEYLEGIDPIDSVLPLEAVMDAEPDLIFAPGETSLQSGDYEQYNSIAPTYVLDQKTADDWRAALTEIGEVLGLEDKAAEALATYDARVAEVKEALNEKTGDSKVAAVWVIGGDYYVVAPDVASGAVLFEDLELEPANAIANLPEDAGAHWNPISLEALAELDADYLFLVDGDPDTIESLKSEAIWSGIPAVEQGNVFEVSGKSSWLYNGYQANMQTIDSVYEHIIGE
ncbi:ABC transporter substrate-binding protein [Shouchella tritolerans]|uniref:ABC transporter substrate-binding protein n=1 Tax=Shouchella tritolerans TaxID=2979466 RepID=UPI0021E78487|nr:ABC transporter substrate-binding protein [Shouchella tritolerans]